jgi:hypothetical protein
MLLEHPLGDRNNADKTPQTAIIMGGLKYARFKIGINYIKMLKLGFWRNSGAIVIQLRLGLFLYFFQSMVQKSRTG